MSIPRRCLPCWRRAHPPLVVLNAKRTDPLQKLSAAPRVYFDCAMCEGVGGIAVLIETVSAERVLFGSHLPLFPLESSLLKLRESDLADAQAEALRQGNARRLLGPGK